MELKSMMAFCAMVSFLFVITGAGYSAGSSYSENEPKGRFEYHPCEGVTSNGSVYTNATGILLDTYTGEVIRINVQSAGWESLDGRSAGNMVAPMVANGTPVHMINKGSVKNGTVLNPGIDPTVE